MSDPEPATTSKGASRRNQIILLGALALILNALFNHLGSNESGLNKILKVGDPFPIYSATALEGKKISNATFEKKPTLYIFFANWCPCSHETIPHILKAYKDYGDQLAMVGVGIQDGEEKLKRFVKMYRLPFSVIIEGGEEMARASGVAITPTTLFVRSDGNVGAIHVGKIEKYEQLLEGISAITNDPVAKGEGA